MHKVGGASNNFQLVKITKNKNDKFMYNQLKNTKITNQKRLEN